jgi:hypothetical protein
LSDSVREKVGAEKGKEVGFIDERDVELGAEWEAVIEQALQNSKVMICLYSPGYFKSSYCGKEWQIFQDRRTGYLVQNQLAPLPPVIKPIVWIPLLQPIDNPVVEDIQYYIGNPDDIHNRKGLKYILQKNVEYKSLYIDYIDKLSNEIIESANRYELPKLAPFPRLQNTLQAFPNNIDQPIANFNTNNEIQFAKHVRFVFVAEDPRNFGNNRAAEAADLYREIGGRDWRPFPGMRCIGPYVQHLVSAEDINFFCDELNLNRNLVNEVEQAYSEGKIVIFIIDSWTVNWNLQYQDILRQLDRGRPLINYSILVTWNENDPDIVRHRAEIEQTLRATFDIRANIWKNPIYYRHSICSSEELSISIIDTLVNLRSEMHKRAPISKVISGGIAKPVINNNFYTA